MKHSKFNAILLFFKLVLTLATITSCSKTASLADRPCPCIVGYKCCETVQGSRCIPEGNACLAEIPAGLSWMGSPGGETLEDLAPVCPNTYPGICEREAGRLSANRSGNLPPSSFEDLHQIQLTHAFGMMVNEVTGPYYALIMGFDPSANPRPIAGRDVDDAWPVDRVTWYDTLAFANLLSEFEGLPPCYKLDMIECAQPRDPISVPSTLEQCRSSRGQIRKAKVSVSGGNVYACSGYRLPTEAEWEYAARAGTLTPNYSGRPGGDLLLQGIDTNLESIAWYDDTWDSTYPSGSFPVRRKEANAFGLHDMLGNLWEWVWDSFTLHYPVPADGTLRVDPVVWNESPDMTFVLRGGGWPSWWSYCRSAQRNHSQGHITIIDKDSRSARGFRLVRTLSIQFPPDLPEKTSLAN